MDYILLSLAFTALFAAVSFSRVAKVWMQALVWLVVFILLVIINYTALPVLSWWGFHGVWVEAFFFSLLGVLVFVSYGDVDPDEIGLVDFLRLLPLGVTIIAFFVQWGQSAEAFHADEYYKRLKVEAVPDSVFNADDPPIIILAPKYDIARMAPCRHIFMTGLFIARIRSALVKSLHSSLETLLNFSVSYFSRT